MAWEWTAVNKSKGTKYNIVATKVGTNETVSFEVDKSSFNAAKTKQTFLNILASRADKVSKNDELLGKLQTLVDISEVI